MSSIQNSSNKVAIVTGAAGGIGKGIALRLVKDGFNVVISDLTAQKDNMAGVVQEAEGISTSSKCVAVVCDVTKEDEVQAMVARTLELFGRLDCMVANAGIYVSHTLAEVPVDTFRKIMDVNAIGVLLCFRNAAAAMIKTDTAKGGRLIAACSISGKQAFASSGAYSASKFAVRALVQTAAKEYAEAGITVNAYAPGMIDTPLSRGLTSYDLGPMSPEEFQSGLVEASLLKRVGQPEDIANLVSFFASEQSSFMTGQTVTIDGGVIFG